VTWFGAQLYLDVWNENFADKMPLLLLFHVHAGGQVFHGAQGVSMIHIAVNGAIRSGATGFCWKTCMIYIAHTHWFISQGPQAASGTQTTAAKVKEGSCV
jgi:hypothetical protein